MVDTVGFNFFFNFNIDFNHLIFNSDLVFFFFENCFGIFYEDKLILSFLKKSKKYVFLVINKIDLNKIDVNLFYFFKIGIRRPYLISVLNSFNISYLFNSVLCSFCFLKKCFFLKKKSNNFKILFLSNDYFGNKKFINEFFNKEIMNNDFRESFFIDFEFNYIKYRIISNNISLNTNFFKKIKKISILKIINNIIISNAIFFFINPLLNIKKYFFNFLIKYFKILIFFFDFSNLFYLSYKIYFKNFFKKKFFLKDFYIFFININKRKYFFYIFYYFYKVFKIDNFTFYKVNFFIKKFNYLLNTEKISKIFIKKKCKIFFKPLIFIFYLNNLYFLNYFFYNLLKKNILSFLKLKSLFFKLKFK